MLCTLINPSDSYTLETDNFNAAAMAIAMIGRGQVGLDAIDNADRTPVIFGWAEWLAERGIDAQTFFFSAQNCEDAAKALESVLIGSVSDRRLYAMAIANVAEADREKFRSEWHDAKRSSMNDIGRVCWANAKRFRQHAERLRTEAVAAGPIVSGR